MSTLAAAVTPKGTSAPGRTNYLAILVGSIAAFVSASVYYGVVFSDLWLQVRRLNPSSVGDVNPSPVQPLVEFHGDARDCVCNRIPGRAPGDH